MSAAQGDAGDLGRGLVRLRIRDDTILASQGDTVLATGRDGFIEGGEELGLFVHETRMLGRYRCRIGRRKPFPAALSNVRQDLWMGYYIVRAPTEDAGNEGGSVREASQEALELRITRRIGEGLHEDIDLENFGRDTATFRLTFEIDADFADLEETQGERKQQGTIERRWSRDGDTATLVLDYSASHRYSHQGHRDTAHTRRTLTLRIDCTDSVPRHRGRRLWFDIVLAPRQRWHACFNWTACIDGDALGEPPCTRVHDCMEPGPLERQYLEEATRFGSGESRTLAPVAIEALDRAREDIAALRLHRLDQGPRAWTVAAGLPMFLALFGRDALTASWQAGLLGPELMRGSLPALAARQGERDDPWRDEQPGRVLHEAHTGPLGELRYNPKARDYFSLTASPLFALVVAQLWRWTADRDAVAPLIDPALRALRWLDTEAVDERGFHAVGTRSRQGIDNQTWKDSSDSLVDEHGAPVGQPAAACEEQGIAFAAKTGLAEVLRAFGRKDEADLLDRNGRELKQRFNDAYWMEDAGFYAMALDPKGRQVRSIGSNALHCLATGIADAALVPRVLERLFQPDLFTGWGIRTLSSEHPAYNPYAYHRGTVWPVEHAPFATGAVRYGRHEETARICRALFEATALFEHRRLPECFAGHPRDAAHPFPAIYPAANVPQAWSASTVTMLLQSLLGLFPDAPEGVLRIEPRLPDWLPEITLSGLRVGSARVDLRFRRGDDGDTTHEVLDQRGKLEIRREPSPWAP